MSSPAESGFPPDDDPLSKAAFDAALAQHDAAIGSTAAELDAEIARLSRGSDILVHPAARPSQPAMAKSGTARIAAYLGVKDEAELIEALLLEEGIPSMQRRSGGFDVPDFLAAGPRDILVPESGAQAAREALAPAP